MAKIVVTKQALREFITKIMENPGLTWQTMGDVGNFPVEVSDVVDFSSAVTDPGNDRFLPRNRAELKVTLSSLIDDMSDDDTPQFYKTLKSCVDGMKDKEHGEMDSNTKIEQIIRGTIRKILREADLPAVKKIPPGVHGAEYMRNLERRKQALKQSLKSMPLEDPPEAEEEPTAGRKNVMMTDVGGSSFKDIAKEMGYASESGAKQAVEKALEKARFASAMDPDDLEIITLAAMNDYIDYLNKSGELTSADVQLMKDHPGIVSELDGWREYFDKVLKKAQKSGQKVINPVED